jgi:hypothetical protein
MGIVTHIADFLVRRSRGAATPELFDELKQSALERILGPMHGYVGHAIIPYQVGGPVDMYYFAQSDGSTAFATMELLNYDGSSPKRSSIGTYELVAFTRLRVTVPEPNPPFDVIENRIRGIFTTIGRYSTEVALNPLETAEVPAAEDEPNRCVIFDEYSKQGTPFSIGDKRYGLLLCVEVHSSELAYARANGTAKLIHLLQNAGHYPNSDLDRDAVA